MFKDSNIHYQIAERTRAIGFGGIGQISTAKNAMNATYHLRLLLMKMIRTVSRLTSRMRAQKIRIGSIIPAWVAESKKVGIISYVQLTKWGSGFF